MPAKKIPLVHYDRDGVRHVIGEGVVDTDGEYWDMTAKITDPDYLHAFNLNVISSLSIGNHEATAIIPKEPDVKQKKGKRQKPVPRPFSRNSN